LERRRKHGAKWTGKNIAADEVVQDVKLGWDAKRDRWSGLAGASVLPACADHCLESGSSMYGCCKLLFDLCQLYSNSFQFLVAQARRFAGGKD
jgi:hypothetical protein